jgi:hypothetical protein
MLEQDVMYEAQFYRLESEISLGKSSVVRVQLDASELRAQVRRLETELASMKRGMDTMRRDYVSWDLVYRHCMRFLNACVIGTTAVLFFALAHGFKWI